MNKAHLNALTSEDRETILDLIHTTGLGVAKLFISLGAAEKGDISKLGATIAAVRELREILDQVEHVADDVREDYK